MNNKEKMHPEDFRNLIIFAVLSLALWFFWENYINKPQREALIAASKAKKELLIEKPELLEPVTYEDRRDIIQGASDARIKVENENIFGSISLKGGRIDDISLKEYFQTLEKEENVNLLSPERTLNSRYVNYGWVSEDKNLKLPGPNTVWEVQGSRELRPGNPVTLYWKNGQGQIFERLLTLDENYVLKITQRIHNQSPNAIVVKPYALVTQTGIPTRFTGRWIAYEGPMAYVGGELVQTSYSEMESEKTIRRSSDTGWIGITDKYWLTALIPQQNAATGFRFHFTADPVHKEKYRYQTDFTGDAQIISANSSTEYAFDLFVGAKKVELLEEYERTLQIKNLDLAVDFGWFWFLTYPFFKALHYLGLMVGNMGVAIIILTICLRMAVYPLTRTTFRSFAKMKVVSPQILEIRDKFGDDKERMQKEIVELYQREGVNPLAGCFPILLQIPIFFSLYKIILVTIELRHAPFFGWIQDLSARDPTSIFNLFGLIPWDPPSILMIGAWPCAMLCVMLVQKRLTPPPQDAIQRDMRNWFPFIITFVMSGFAAGLVIYWTFSALISILQQTYIMKQLGVPIYIFEKDKFEEALEKKMEKGPDVHPLAEMAEEEVEKAMFGEHENEGNETAEGESEGADNKPDIKPPKKKKKKKKK